MLDKLNTVLEMFNVYGYRHYHNFDEWMRISLLQSVESELAGEWARTRGIVDRATIVTLAQDTARREEGPKLPAADAADSRAVDAREQHRGRGVSAAAASAVVALAFAVLSLAQTARRRGGVPALRLAPAGGGTDRQRLERRGARTRAVRAAGQATRFCSPMAVTACGA